MSESVVSNRVRVESLRPDVDASKTAYNLGLTNALAEYPNINSLEPSLARGSGALAPNAERRRVAHPGVAMRGRLEKGGRILLTPAAMSLVLPLPPAVAPVPCIHGI